MAKRLLVPLLCLLLLAGCSAEPEMQTFTCRDLGITLPSAFQKTETEGYDFLYSSGIIAILGMEELKETVAPYLEATTAAAYAALLAEQVGATEAPAQKDGYLRFAYTAAAEGTQMCYITAVYETEESFWALQAYCTAEHYERYAQTMEGYLANVKLN